MATIVDQAKAQMAKSVESTKENFSGIRTGRANPALLNGITVDYYGAPTPLKAVATMVFRSRAPWRSLLSMRPRPTPWRRRFVIPISEPAPVATQRHSPDHAGADRRASQGIRQDCQGQG